MEAEVEGVTEGVMEGEGVLDGFRVEVKLIEGVFEGVGVNGMTLQGVLTDIKRSKIAIGPSSTKKVLISNPIPIPHPLNELQMVH